MSEDDGLKAMGQVIQIDEARIRDHLGEMVRGTVEETLNALLDAEADRLCGAGRYERTQGRQDTRGGSYERALHTVAGEVNLKVPKLRRQTFETAIIERYRRRESSVEEALIEMYLAGVSVRRVEDITEALWGTRVSPSTVSELNKKIYGTIEAWRNRTCSHQNRQDRCRCAGVAAGSGLSAGGLDTRRGHRVPAPTGESPQPGRSASDPDQERGACHPAGASRRAVPACRSVRPAGSDLARTAGTAGRRAGRHRAALART